MGRFLSTPVSTVFIWLGLFTVSWDKLANFSVGSFNVKVPVIFFGLGFVLTLVDYLSVRKLRPAPRDLLIPLLALLLLAVYTGVGLFGLNMQISMLEVVSEILGAFLPFFAIFLNIRVNGRLRGSLTAFIWGAVASACFGIYQLVAFYAGLPQGIPYEAQAGGWGRISSFSYESGYFGYFMILAIGAVFARAYLDGKRPGLPLVSFLAIVLLVANTRAIVFTLPLLIIFLLMRGKVRRVRFRWVTLSFCTAIAVLLLGLLVPAFWDQVYARFSTVFDPREATSNAPRLERLELAADVFSQYPIFGLGPGNFVTAVSRMGISTGEVASNDFIANNVWYQALLDGGIVLLAAEMLLVLVAVRRLYRPRTPVARALMAGWLSAFLVSSLITSYYFDMKMWAVLALALAASHAASPYGRPHANIPRRRGLGGQGFDAPRGPAEFVPDNLPQKSGL